MGAVKRSVERKFWKKNALISSGQKRSVMMKNKSKLIYPNRRDISDILEIISLYHSTSTITQPWRSSRYNRTLWAVRGCHQRHPSRLPSNAVK